LYSSSSVCSAVDYSYCLRATKANSIAMSVMEAVVVLPSEAVPVLLSAVVGPKPVVINGQGHVLAASLHRVMQAGHGLPFPRHSPKPLHVSTGPSQKRLLAQGVPAGEAHTKPEEAFLDSEHILHTSVIAQGLVRPTQFPCPSHRSVRVQASPSLQGTVGISCASASSAVA